VWYDDMERRILLLFSILLGYITATLTLHSLEKMPYYAAATAGDGFSV